MTKRMLIDASHAEETRVVVLDGNRLEEFDLEAATRKPLKGNIYLAKVVRVEPSLQAAFVEYGGNRHGFLAFGEIHPDYYQIPVADRQRLLQMQAEEAREAEEADEDPIPESPMDRAAEDELTARARAAEEAIEGFDAEAGEPEPEGQDRPDPTAAPAAAAAPAEAPGDPASPGPEAGPPPGIASAAAAESEAGAAQPDAASPVPVEEAGPDAAVAPGAAPATIAAADAGSAAADAAEAGAPGEGEAPAGPIGGEADAAAAPGTDPGFDAAPAEALEAGSLAEGEAGPEEEAAADLAGPETGAAPRRAQGEPRQARRRDGRGRGRRDDRAARGDDARAARGDDARAARGDDARAARGDDARTGRGDESRTARGDDPRTGRGDDPRADDDAEEEEAPPETLGGEGPEEGENGREEGRRIPPRFLRHYKIQEVIKRRQIMLVQVVKEERGTKGAALTTYISLAGRFSVLMPNSPRGGGVSRKITSAADRKRLREAIDELALPDGMSLIVRTAGAQRPKPEIKRDCEYLLRLWDNIRERTLASTAPALIYEEADLIKRAIRDVFSRDVEEIVVEGEDAYQEARDFMRMLMPQHVKKIQYAREGGLFARAQVEQQLDAMHSPTVQLKSGGYIVINQTEALVAIDVNSGRATRERHIEDTALRTNLEAADEIARQLRLRDLAGLIVIDFIDMESSKHDGMVERRLKEALRFDRARIQVGRISHFGLLEMSRQRLRPSLAETSFVTCPHCQGRGTVRSIESSALSVLRAIEEEGAKRRSAEIAVHCCSAVALYLLNRKRDRLTQLEEHFGMAVLFEPDESLAGPQHRIERLRAAEPAHGRALPPAHQAALRMDYAPEPEEEDEEEAEEAEAAPEEGAAAEAGAATAPETEAEAEARAEAGRRRRRRRRRRGGPRPEGAPDAERGAGEEQGEDSEDEEGDEEEAEAPEPLAAEAPRPEEAEEGEPGAPPAEPGEPRGPRRRRRRGPRPEGQAADGEAPRAAPPPRSPPPRPQPAPRYMGPTPADPFAGHVDDILAAMEAAEAAAEAAAVNRRGRVAVAPVPEAMPGPAMEPAMGAGPAPGPAPQDDAAGAAAPEAALAEAPPPPAPEAPAAEAAPIPATDAEAAPPPAAADAGAVPASAEDAAPAAEAPPDAVPNGAAAPHQGPPVQPRLLDEVPPEAPRRGGWWRR